MSSNNNIPPEMIEVVEKNKIIFQDTISCIHKGEYISPTGRVIKLNLQDMISGSVMFDTEIHPSKCTSQAHKTIITIENADCLTVAEQLVRNNYNPLLLNFASSSHAGGGVEKGAWAQEESLCRRTTLCRSIYSYDAVRAQKYGFDVSTRLAYPMQPIEFAQIYSPFVTVFREGEDCTKMEEPFYVSIITNAAINFNGRHGYFLTEDGHMPEDTRIITKNKIRAIFRAGVLFNHDALILGAFGCGAFKTPPCDMALLFREIINEPEFRGHFRSIVFAIKEDHFTKNANYEVFENVLKDCLN